MGNERPPAIRGGTHMSIQVHRLSGAPNQMNAHIQRAYGAFRSRLRFSDLGDTLTSEGIQLIEVERSAWDVREYAYPPTLVSILVATAAADMGLHDGDVWQISCGNVVRGTGYADPR